METFVKNQSKSFRPNKEVVAAIKHVKAVIGFIKLNYRHSLPIWYLFRTEM